jgi:hypothetical protein
VDLSFFAVSLQHNNFLSFFFLGYAFLAVALPAKQSAPGFPLKLFCRAKK